MLKVVKLEIKRFVTLSEVEGKQLHCSTIKKQVENCFSTCFFMICFFNYNVSFSHLKNSRCQTKLF